eukprot:3940808-Rhodomonas_salina.5
MGLVRIGRYNGGVGGFGSKALVAAYPRYVSTGHRAARACPPIRQTLVAAYSRSVPDTAWHARRQIAEIT